MLSNLSIRQKMLLLILGLTVLIYLITFMFIIDSVRDKALEEGRKSASLVAEKKANKIKAVLDEDMAVSRIMARAVEDMIDLSTDERDKRKKELLDEVLLQYPKYDATWVSLQYEFVDPNWKNDFGRERYQSFMINNNLNSTVEVLELDGISTSGIYEAFKTNSNLKELLSEPYSFKSYDSTDTLVAISPCIRIEYKGKFAGLVGSDMSIKDFQDISEVNYNEESNAYAVLLSSGGTICAYKDPGLFNTSMDTLDILSTDQYNVKEMLEAGEAFSYTIMDNSLGEEVYVYFAPIPVGRTGKNWTICTVVPVEEIMAPYTPTFRATLYVLLVGLIILTVSILYISYSITNPLSKSTRLLEDLAQGKLDSKNKLKVRGRDELSKISRSLNKLVDSLQVKTEFAQKIGEGHLDAKAEVEETDVLGKALVQMQSSLKTAIGDIKSLVKASENISGNVVSQAENIHQTANTGYSTSSNGLNLVNNMSESMSAISKIASDTNASFRVLEQRSKDISKVVKVITDLSKQTNLLAINAAIQASRAGEAGKGFAVVANEIRRLAESSEKSAKEITNLVTQIQADTVEASSMIDQMTESIQKGESATAETSEAFKNISNSVTDTVSLSESILDIAREQISKIQEVARNTESIVIK